MPKKVYKNKECRFCHRKFTFKADEEIAVKFRAEYDEKKGVVKNFNQIKCPDCGKWSREYKVSERSMYKWQRR